MDMRDEFDAALAQLLNTNNVSLRQEEIAEWIREEQRDIVRRMQLGPGIGINDNVLESVFTMLVCIFLRIPVFLVGPPGSSKTLAIKVRHTSRTIKI